MIVELLAAERFYTFVQDPRQDVQPGGWPGDLVLLTGDNGAGKTAYGLEALAWLLWGETVRGIDPGEASVWGLFDVRGQKYWVRRVRVKKRQQIKLEFQLRTDLQVCGQDLTGQTPTETQERIDRVFGSWRRFVATRVFSRRLLNRFGAATDKERKLLLEEVLGLDRFELAYQRARQVLGERRNQLVNDESAYRAACAAHDQAVQALQTIANEPAGRSVAQIEELMRAAQQVVQQTEQEVARATQQDERLRQVVQQYEKRLSMAEGAAQQAERQAARLRQQAREGTGVCPTCRRPLEPKGGGDHLEEEAGRLEQQARDERAAVQSARVEHQKALEAKVQVVNRLVGARNQLHVSSVQLRELQVELQATRQAVERVARLDEQARVTGERRNEAEANLVEAQRDARVAEQAAELLGPKGVRARILAGALPRLEQEVNRVVVRLGGQVQAVHLTGTRERADGGVVAEVSISVRGAGGGDYRGVSDGEQVRIDVALLLALARLSGDTGYLAFDEVFDPLDGQGLEGAVGLVEELAATRQTIVITHNPRFVAQFPRGARWRAERTERGSRVVRS